MNTTDSYDRSFSVDPKEAYLIDQALWVSGEKINVYFPLLWRVDRSPMCQRKEAGTQSDFSLLQGKVRPALKVSFIVDRTHCEPEKESIEVALTKVKNEQIYQRLQQIQGLNISHQSILDDVRSLLGKTNTGNIDTCLYRAAHIALSIYASEKDLPFLYYQSNMKDLSCGNKKIAGLSKFKHVWTAPLRRIVDRINHINLTSLLISGGDYIFTPKDLERVSRSHGKIGSKVLDTLDEKLRCAHPTYAYQLSHLHI